MSRKTEKSLSWTMCRKTGRWRSLTSVFQQVSDVNNLYGEKTHCVALANILIINFCKASTPLLRKEVKQKVIKLT